jgi:hypothetical protein
MRLSLALPVLVLLTCHVVTNDAQEESDRNLRRGRGRGRGRGGIFKRYSNDPGGEDEEDVSVIVQCSPFTENKCLEDIKAVTDGPPIKIVQQLDGTDFVAIEMKRFQAATINSISEVAEIMDDPIRDTLYIRESYRIETRQLQGQSMPYGIPLVKADKVWDRTKGAGVRVCVMDTGLYLNQDDFTPKSRFSGARNVVEDIYDWVRSDQ